MKMSADGARVLVGALPQVEYLPDPTCRSFAIYDADSRVAYAEIKGVPYKFSITDRALQLIVSIGPRGVLQAVEVMGSRTSWTKIRDNLPRSQAVYRFGNLRFVGKLKTDADWLVNISYAPASSTILVSLSDSQVESRFIAIGEAILAQVSIGGELLNLWIKNLMDNKASMSEEEYRQKIWMEVSARS